MSGIKRSILAEIVADGKTSAMEVQKMFSPEAMRMETGRSNNTSVSNKSDSGKYLGKNGTDATK